MLAASSSELMGNLKGKRMMGVQVVYTLIDGVQVAWAAYNIIPTMLAVVAVPIRAHPPYAQDCVVVM